MRKITFYIDSDELKTLYLSQHLSINQIAKKCGVSYTTIWWRLHNCNIGRRGKGEAHKNKFVSADTRLKISEGNKGNTKWLGRHHTLDAKVKIRQHRIGTSASSETRRKMSETHIKRWQSPILKKRVSEAHKRNWQNPEYAEKVVRNTAIAQNRHPNGKETIIISLLKELGLNTWEFTDDGRFTYGRKSPDFMDIEKRDKVIEMFGDYWHGEKARCYEETEEGRIAHFAKFGLDALIIWEHELKHPDIVKEKIAEFVKVVR